MCIVRIDPLDMSSPDVEAVCLPSQGEQPDPAAECYIGGWGVDNSGGLPSIVQTNWNSIVSDQDCQSVFGGSFVPHAEICSAKVIDGNICQGSICNGDSGGPLVCIVDGSARQYGVSSYVATGCRWAGAPGVFAEMSHYIEWMDCEINGNCPTTQLPPTTELPPDEFCIPDPNDPNSPPAPPCGDDCQLPEGLQCAGNVFGDNKIIQGTDARPHSWPFIISLQGGIGNIGSHFCGGSILNSEWMMTAAHCCDGATAGTFEVVVGAHNRLSQSPNEQRRVVRQIVMHPNFADEGFIANDMCLLKVDPIDMSSPDVEAVCLPAQGALPASTECYIGGWGVVDDGSMPTILQTNWNTVLSDEQCVSIWGPGTFIAHAEICATKVLDGNICLGNVCNGDSGGPLVCVVRGAAIQYGVTSYGPTGCKAKGLPAVFAEVSAYIDWISGIVTPTDSDECTQADQDACISDTGEANVCRCTHVINGNPHCKCCDPGTTFESDTSNNCVDIDECADGTHTCAGDEVCVNTNGGYQCQTDNGQCMMYWVGVDFPYADITSGDKNSANECMEWCIQMTNCNVFAWMRQGATHFDKGYCWLKGYVQQLNYMGDERISGVKCRVRNSRFAFFELANHNTSLSITYHILVF